ncbi:hypothetical protein J8273_0509 [Carpediemonas membranifera]|uniref:Uncharacterized protein n=1 Tax=Carpediemonas membranifera TaxID=201153 RepID=A0A8J6B917_9EUKA|nr:hypothetical protein J8273_0509 [Carpediemonas membranifera]|eukprot:KAG9395282.1 hypothetical protein J8273_0509 [Carpediemonas membranifera]
MFSSIWRDALKSTGAVDDIEPSSHDINPGARQAYDSLPPPPMPVKLPGPLDPPSPPRIPAEASHQPVPEPASDAEPSPSEAEASDDDSDVPSDSESDSDVPAEPQPVVTTGEDGVTVELPPEFQERPQEASGSESESDSESESESESESGSESEDPEPVYRTPNTLVCKIDALSRTKSKKKGMAGWRYKFDIGQGMLTVNGRENLISGGVLTFIDPL